ncbi:hypothetical protein BMF94_3028 [Rhodotorula taiwanensis]|uniref:Uncharacterized protein n=1 Tax=Rhodotorula taiwanensis TaxID=741276 RepID=A0A2S5BAR5_9BASI|nr:hypothetical protein BMF94_3028 [Rhodotorula taiwanensis]
MTIKRTRAFLQRRADADRLAELFERGTLLEIMDELDDPVWTADRRRHKDYLPSPEIPVDALGSRGLTLLGEALTAPRPLEFRLALICVLLERGAQPCTVSETGRSVAWAIEQVQHLDPYAANILGSVIGEAQGFWKEGVPFEIPPGIDEWIREELDLLRQQPEESVADPAFAASPYVPTESLSPAQQEQEEQEEQQPVPLSPLPDYVDEDTPVTTDAAPDSEAPASVDAPAGATGNLQGSGPGSDVFARLSQKPSTGVATTGQAAQAAAGLGRDASRSNASPSLVVWSSRARR